MNIEAIASAVRASLAEDIGSGDISAALLPKDQIVTARIVTREAAVLCGKAWVQAVYHQLNPNIKITWQAQEGEKIIPNQCVAELIGDSRCLITGERCALNWLQTLSEIGR